MNARNASRLTLWLRSEFLLESSVCLLIILMGLFPFDFARLRIGPFYVPWAAFVFIAIVPLWGAKLFRSWRSLYWNYPLIIAIAGFGIALIIPLIFGRPPTGMIVELIFYLAVAVVLMNVVGNGKMLSRVCKLFVLIGSFLAVWGLVRIIWGGASYFSLGSQETIGTRNSAAFLLEVSYFLSWAQIFLETRGRRVIRVMVVVGAVFMLSAILLSFSRGTWISVFIGQVAILAIAPHRTRRVFLNRILGTVGVLTAAIALSLLVKSDVGNRLYSRMNTIPSVSVESSNYTRWKLLTESWAHIKKDPFIGIGAGNFSKEIYVENLAGKQMAHPHNAYIYVWLEEGSLGFVSFLFLLMIPLLRLWKRVRKEDPCRWTTAGLAVVLLAYSVHFLFSVFFNMLFFWIVYGVGLAASDHSRLKASQFAKESTQ